jgi:lysine 6-dehydrogenase
MVKALCLGGAGRICRESVLDLAQFADFEQITVADVNEPEGRAVVAASEDTRVDFLRVDVADASAAIDAMRGYDIVLDGTTIALNGRTTALIAQAGCHAINLNGFGEEGASDALFKAHGRTCVPGFGMTPGITQMMAMAAANELETIDEVRVSHGAFRPIAFSRSIAATTMYEYDPALPGRVVFEDGQFVQVPPFARPRQVLLPEPYGLATQYIIPHAETRTLAKALAPKGVRLIEVRGTWPPRNMQLIRALHDWGFMRNDPVVLGGGSAGVLDCIAEYLLNSREGTETELYGYALHVEVTGTANGRTWRHTLTHTHPASDGSVAGWEKLRAYTRNVGIPMSIGAQVIAGGDVALTGVITPEEAFDPGTVFAQLARRDIHIHHEIVAVSTELVQTQPDQHR